MCKKKRELNLPKIQPGAQKCWNFQPEMWGQMYIPGKMMHGFILEEITLIVIPIGKVRIRTNAVKKKHTSDRAVAQVSALSWPETVKNAGFPKKS